MDYAYQGKHPPTKLAIMVTSTNVDMIQDQPWLADSAATNHVTASLNNLSFQNHIMAKIISMLVMVRTCLSHK